MYEARGPDDFDGVFAALARDRVGGLVVLADANSYTHRARLNDLCLQHRMPSVWGGRDFLTGGGLASYQSDFPAIFVRAATLVDKILKGEKPADIPFEQATKLELIVDLRAAKSPRHRDPAGAASKCRRGDPMMARRAPISATGWRTGDLWPFSLASPSESLLSRKMDGWNGSKRTSHSLDAQRAS